MNITKFKLINGGIAGIVVDAKESIPYRGHMMIVDDVNRTRRIILPESIRRKVQEMKYFFLNITSHWIEPYNKFYDIKSYTLSDPPQTLKHLCGNDTLNPTRR